MENIPYGYCRCGCGQKTKIAKQSKTARGQVRGEPFLYIHGHNVGTIRDGSVLMLKCCTCGQTKGLSSFKKAPKSTWSSECKTCAVARNQVKTALGLTRERRNKLRLNYGLTEEMYIALLKQQTYACAICKESFGETKMTRPHVDHCHTTGVVRGLLCSPCNIALGLMKDDVVRLRKAADYLKKDRARRR